MQVLTQIQDFFKIFINQQQAKNLSQNTINTYIRVFDKFYDYLASEVENQQIKEITDINNSFLSLYLISLEKSGLSNTTRSLHVTVLKQLLWFIADYDVKLYGILRSKITGVKVKLPEKEVKTYNDNEQAKIIGLINKLDNSRNFRDHRMSLILKLLLFHGIRISELINLKWQNVEEIYDENEGYIYKFNYTGKGSKERDLDFPISFVNKNIEIIKDHVESEYVIPSSKGTKSYRHSIYESVKSLLAVQGIKEVWLHKFRHTFGQNKVNEGVNSSTITELMGHSNPAVTYKFYLRNNKKAKRKAILGGLPTNFKK